jgi:hypothetical protein
MLFSIIRRCFAFSKSRVIAILTCVLQVFQLQALTKIVDRQVEATASQPDKTTIAPAKEALKPETGNTPTSLPRDAETDVDAPVIPFPLRENTATSRAIVPVPPHPNFPPNWIAKVEHDAEVSGEGE